MKQAWVLGLSGMFFGVLLLSAFNISKAWGDKKDERAKTIENVDASGKNAEVPLTKDLENSLKQKEKELSDKERVLKEKEEALAVEDQRVKMRIDELEDLQKEVMKYQEKNSEKADEQLKKIVKTFEIMNPKKASAVFMTMKDDLAVELLTSMKEKKAAAIMEMLQPDRANLLSSRMAQRRPAGRAVGDIKEIPPKRNPSP